jgi:transcriptional regulator with XRE-family HTH domain
MAAIAAAGSKSATRRPRTQDVDRHVGDRMRQRRIMLGLTQQQLADLIGVTYQQAHKYERGINRIAGGRLYTIAQALGVEVAFFFEGIGAPAGAGKPTAHQRLLLELTRNFVAITDRRQQDAICSLARSLACLDTAAAKENDEVAEGMLARVA